MLFSQLLCIIQSRTFKMKITKKKIFYLTLSCVLGFYILNSFTIYRYSSVYSEMPSDIAIVLGAGSNNGKVSPVFRERINHSIYLYQTNIVDKILITGGFGEGQKTSDSKAGQQYAINKGIPISDIIIEEKSRYTIENLIQSKIIMDSMKIETALIVSDPLHMKRSIELAKNLNISCKPSPTKTTMYQSKFPKLKSLLYESFYYSLGMINGNN